MIFTPRPKIEKTDKCGKCKQQYRVQDLHICKPPEKDDLLSFLKGFKK